MELSPRARELHRQEQNLFQLIQLFNTHRFHLQDPQAELFWELVVGVEAKVFQENNGENFPDIDLIFFAIQTMRIDQGHPFYHHIADWLLLLPPFVNTAFNRWLCSQHSMPEQHSPVTRSLLAAGAATTPQDSHNNSDKPFFVMGGTISVPGQLGEEFVAHYYSLCESVGIAIPKISAGESSVSITVPDFDKMETYTVLLESALLEQKPKEELKEYSLRDFVLM